MRKCCSCNQIKPKSELTRVVRVAKTGEVMIDRSGKLDGRGAYICKNEKCVRLAIKSRKIERSLKHKVKPEFYEELDLYE